MNTRFILRQEIKLSSIQEKMISSGWGAETLENTLVEKITYLSGGLKINGYLAYPKDQSKQYPCIIWCRGGFGNAGAIDEFNAKGIFGQIASWGYVVLASQYRGNAGSEGEDEFGGSDVDDILNLIPLADELKFANTAKWGIEGWSRGGLMTYLTLTRTGIFKAAVVIGAIGELRNNSGENNFMQHLIERMKLNYTDVDFQNEFEKRSILNFPGKLCRTTPLLLLHGTNDNRVSPEDSIRLAGKLQELNHPHKLVLLEGGDHFLKTHRDEAAELRREWFAKYLK